MGIPILTSEGFVGQRKIMGKTDKLHKSLVSGIRVRTGMAVHTKGSTCQ